MPILYGPSASGWRTESHNEVTISIVELSDIHLRTDRDNPVLERREKLIAAIRSSLALSDGCILIVSGDIAFSGKEAEYALAHDLLDHILLALLDSYPDLEIEEVYVPGNHDCDLAVNPRSREYLLDDLLKHGDVSARLDEIGECLAVQNNFFTFAARRLNRTFPHVNDRLAWEQVFSFGGKSVRIRSFNSAWLTRLKEKKGQLLAPVWLAHTDFQGELDISVFHHPVSWFETTNARGFQKQVDHISDLVYTGHEHDPDAYTKERITGEVSVHFEASALQDENDPTISGFYVYTVNLESREYSIEDFQWAGDIYHKVTQTALQPLIRRQIASSERFILDDAWATNLDDPGAGYTHPRKAHLSLRDIFVYPDLSEWNIAKGQARIKMSNRTSGSHLAGTMRNHPKSIAFGPEQSGKTALAKAVYQDLLDLDVVPVYLTGDQFKSTDPQSVAKVIERQFSSQYSPGQLDKYLQLPNERKAFIVDNFHRNVFNRTGWTTLVRSLEIQCGSLLLLASDNFQIRELRDLNMSEHPLLDFKRFWINEFGHSRRYELIGKWFMLGQELTASDDDKLLYIKEVEHLMRTVLGRNLVPSLPIFVLSILQTQEAASTADTTTGAYSYHFEALIKEQLRGVKSSIGPNILNGYLSFVAFQVFKMKRKYFEDGELQQLTAKYDEEYAQGVQGKLPEQALLDAKVIARTSSGGFRFMYTYMYYYFVASYFATHLRLQKYETELRASVEYIVHHLHVEDYANVLIFLTYLTSDEEIIRLVMDRAKEQYPSYQPCNLREDFDFLAEMVSVDINNLPPLDDPDDPETQLRYRERTDDGEATDWQYEDEDAVITERQLDEFLQINVALKVMQILGQIARNIPGTLPADLKLELVEHGYLVGLRIMQYVLSQARDNLKEIIQFFAARLQQELHITDSKELAERSGVVLADLMLMAGFGIIQRTSYAMGSGDLAETYKALRTGELETAYRLIGASIKMDHFTSFPKKEIENLYTGLERHPLSRIILRWLVRDYFNKYPGDRVLRQSVCSRLEIPINDVRYITTVNKKFLRKGNK